MSATASDTTWTGWRWDGERQCWIKAAKDATLAGCNFRLRTRCPDAVDGHLALTGGAMPQWVPE